MCLTWGKLHETIFHLSDFGSEIIIFQLEYRIAILSGFMLKRHTCAESLAVPTIECLPNAFIVPRLDLGMAILVAILNLRTLIEIYMTFDCFNGSAIVNNMCRQKHFTNAYFDPAAILKAILLGILNLRVMVSLYMSLTVSGG